jgi:hypothetical protein
MVDIRLVRAFVGTASLVATMATAAPTMQRAWVSGAGADTPTCGPAATPCRTFQYMHDNIVVNGGSIFVKDSAGYGPIAISKSISIINDGAAMAAIFAASGNAISVAGSGAVVLKGLTLDGGGSATNGVAFTSNSGSLTMANCTVRGFASNGVSVVPLHDGNIAIVDSLITGNAGAGVYTFGDSSGQLTLTLSRDKIVNNGFTTTGYGVRLTGGIAAFQFSTIESTVIGENGIGLSVEASGVNIVSGALFDSKIVGSSNTSINVTSGATVWLEKTSVQSSFNGITNNGSIVSFGDNAILDSVTGSPITKTSLQ